MGAPEGNQNALVWTIEEATKFFKKAIDMAMEKEEGGGFKYDFIGELATDLGYSKAIFANVASTHPKELEPLYSHLTSIFESNCYQNGKKKRIDTGMAIMNLKSNHKWKDRIDATSNDETIGTVDAKIAEMSARMKK